MAGRGVIIRNEQLFRILGRFEQGPDGGAALTSYLCPAGVWTLAYGCTKHPDGSSVKEGDTITADQVMPYTEAAVQRVISDVLETIKRPLNEYQLAAIAAFVFNCGIGNLRKSTRLLPAIEAGRWEDAAEAMGEFVRAWGHHEGRWHRQALLGLRIRRYYEGCILLGLDPEDACNADNIGMPKRREWQPDALGPDGSKGRYYDVLLDGATEFTTIEAMARATPLPPLNPVPTSNTSATLTTKADPAAVPATGAAGQPEKPPSPAPADPAPVKEPAKTSLEVPVTSTKPENVDMKPAAPASPSVVAGPAPAKPTAAPQPPLAPVPSTKLPEKPVILTPQPVNPNALPTNADTAKNMADSTRMIGMVLVAIGSVIQVVTLRLGIGTAIGAVFFDLSRDPVVITLTVTAIVAALGWVTKRNGKKTFAKGADQMVQTLY